MTPLMPSLVKGSHVYRPSQGTHGAAIATAQQLVASTVGENPGVADPTTLNASDEDHDVLS